MHSILIFGFGINQYWVLIYYLPLGPFLKFVKLDIIFPLFECFVHVYLKSFFFAPTCCYQNYQCWCDPRSLNFWCLANGTDAWYWNIPVYSYIEVWGTFVVFRTSKVQQEEPVNRKSRLNLEHFRKVSARDCEYNKYK